MTDFPKRYTKGASERVAHNVRDEVKLQFAGYHVAKPEAEKAPTKTVTLELTEAEMAKLPEAKDAQVVDLTAEANWETNGGATKPAKRN